MENDILDSLQSIGYSGPLLEEGELDKALQGSYKSPEFRRVVVWLAAELKALCKLDEEVNDITTPEDCSSFLLELSSFLKEMGCQYKVLTEGHMTERLQSRENCLLLLHYLLAELQAARMVSLKQPTISPHMQIKLQETSTASELKNMLMTLKFPKPPDNIPPSILFGKVEQKLKEVVSRAPPDLLSKPLFTDVLSDKQWHILAGLQTDLHQEYRMRREMLIKRLDVTIQSFQWSDRVKDKGEQIASAMAFKRKAMSLEPEVRLADLLAAREDLAILEKTSSASVRKNTKSNLNKVIIGQVPDRGGRTTDQAPPPPEMPSWQKDRNPSASRGGYGGGGGGGRGGGGRGGGRGGGDRNRVQGGWNQGSNERGKGWNQGGHDRRSHQDDRKNHQDHNQSNYHQGGGYHGDNNYQGGGGSHHHHHGGGHRGGGRGHRDSGHYGGRRDDRDGGRRDDREGGRRDYR